MQVKCAIDTYRGVKKGLKLTLHIDEKDKAEFMKHLHNFDDKPLLVDFNINANEQIKKLAMISPEQRRKIYALFNDIASYTGDNAEAVKINMKYLFRQSNDLEDFSLSDCESDTAREFITFLIAWCFINAVDLKEHPKDLIDDVETYLYLCIKYKKCSICGQPAEVHHVDAIGMGRDRKNYDDSKHEKIALCRTHHSESHNIGWQTFTKKYHVKGIVMP